MQDSLRRLLERRRRARQRLPPLEEIVRGSVFTRRLRCGKATCRCTRGALHTATYLSVGFAGGRTEQMTLPAPLVPIARRWVANYLRWWKAVETISALNRQLLRQRRMTPPKGSTQKGKPSGP